MKTCNWDGCNNPQFGGGYCRWHQHKRTDKKPKPIIPKKNTGEFGFFLKKWNATPSEQRVSFISGCDISGYFNTEWFPSINAHVLSKKQYPKFRLEDKNVVYLTPSEHFLFDSGTEEQRLSYVHSAKDAGIIVDWEKLYQLKQQLKDEYNKI